jgi:hypothetical protein
MPTPADSAISPMEAPPSDDASIALTRRHFEGAGLERQCWTAFAAATIIDG